MTALRSGCLLFYWIQKLWALQSIKLAEAVVCARFILYYMLCYHNIFCALMAAFFLSVNWIVYLVFGASPSLSPSFKLFFSLKSSWRVLRIRKVWPCWECVSFPPWERTNPSCVQLSSQYSQCTGSEGLKKFMSPDSSCPAAVVKQLSWPLARLWRDLWSKNRRTEKPKDMQWGRFLLISHTDGIPCIKMF